MSNEQITADCFVFIYKPPIYLSGVESVQVKKNHILFSCFVGYLCRIDITNVGNSLLLLKKYRKMHDDIIIGVHLDGILGFVSTVFCIIGK